MNYNIQSRLQTAQMEDPIVILRCCMTLSRCGIDRIKVSCSLGTSILGMEILFYQIIIYAAAFDHGNDLIILNTSATGNVALAVRKSTGTYQRLHEQISCLGMCQWQVHIKLVMTSDRFRCIPVFIKEHKGKITGTDGKRDGFGILPALKPRRRSVIRCKTTSCM